MPRLTTTPSAVAPYQSCSSRSGAELFGLRLLGIQGCQLGKLVGPGSLTSACSFLIVVGSVDVSRRSSLPRRPRGRLLLRGVFLGGFQQILDLELGQDVGRRLFSASRWHRGCAGVSGEYARDEPRRSPRPCPPRRCHAAMPSDLDRRCLPCTQRQRARRLHESAWHSGTRPRPPDGF